MILYVKTTRFVCAAVVFGLTVIGIVWIATYRIVILYADHARWMNRADPPAIRSLPVPPWWNGYVAVAFAIAGLAAALRLLPERRSFLARARELVGLQVARALTGCRTGARESPRAVLKALDWLVAEPLRLLVKH